MAARGATPGAARPTFQQRPSDRGCSDPQNSWQVKARQRSEGVSRSQTLGVTSATAPPLTLPSSALGLPQEITLSAARSWGADARRAERAWVRGPRARLFVPAAPCCPSRAPPAAARFLALQLLRGGAGNPPPRVPTLVLKVITVDLGLGFGL